MLLVTAFDFERAAKNSSPNLIIMTDDLGFIVGNVLVMDAFFEEPSFVRFREEVKSSGFELAEQVGGIGKFRCQFEGAAAGFEGFGNFSSFCQNGGGGKGRSRIVWIS